MMQIIPSLGPMADERLSKMRAAALLAIDRRGWTLPTEVADYLVEIEQRYLRTRYEDSQRFVRETWEGRAKEDGK